MRHLLLIYFFTVTLALAQIDPRGRQHPYTSTVLTTNAQIVTTSYTVKYLCIIDVTMDGTNTVAETNTIPIRTNIISVTVTNVTVPN